MTTNDAVAKRINKLLQEKDMTRYELEQKSGVFHGAMDRILGGLNFSVSLCTIYKLARGFDIDYLQFLNDEVFRSEDMQID